MPWVAHTEGAAVVRATLPCFSAPKLSRNGAPLCPKRAAPGAAAQNAGCIQSDACISCLTAAGSLQPGSHHAFKAAPCAANCYPDGAARGRETRNEMRPWAGFPAAQISMGAPTATARLAALKLSVHVVAPAPGAVADEGVRQLRMRAATPQQRFFMAIGFKRHDSADYA